MWMMYDDGAKKIMTMDSVRASVKTCDNYMGGSNDDNEQI